MLLLVLSLEEFQGKVAAISAVNAHLNDEVASQMAAAKAAAAARDEHAADAASLAASLDAAAAARENIARDSRWWRARVGL